MTKKRELRAQRRTLDGQRLLKAKSRHAGLRKDIGGHLTWRAGCAGTTGESAFTGGTFDSMMGSAFAVRPLLVPRPNRRLAALRRMALFVYPSSHPLALTCRCSL